MTKERTIVSGERVKKIEEAGKEILARRCFENAFWEILTENKDLLPSYVVQIEGETEQYTLLRGVCCQEVESYYFFDDKKGLYRTESFDKYPVVSLIEKPVENYEMGTVLLGVEKDAKTENKYKAVVPEGFVVFRYKCAGEEITTVIRATDQRKATQLLLQNLYDSGQDSFEEFIVNTGEGWKWVGLNVAGTDRSSLPSGWRNIGTNNGGKIGDSIFRELGKLNCYFYEEETTQRSDRPGTLFVFGEGPELAQVISELAERKIFGRIRNIYDYPYIFPQYKGKTVLAYDDGRWARTADNKGTVWAAGKPEGIIAFGFEKIKNYLEALGDRPAIREEVPVTMKLRIVARWDDEEARELVSKLSDKLPELNEAGIDYFWSETSDSDRLSLYIEDHDHLSGPRWYPEETINKIIGDLDEKKRLKIEELLK